MASNPFDTPTQPVQPTTPFESTPLGIATNTAKGFFPNLGETVKDIGQSIARNIGNVGVTLAKPFGGSESLPAPADTTFEGQVFRKIFGTEELKSLEQKVADTELAIQNNEFAQRTGLAKISLPLAFGGIIGEAALDTTPITGSKSAIKQLIKETATPEVVKLLTRRGVPMEVAEEFAPHFAKAGNEKEVLELADIVYKSQGSKLLEDLTNRKTAISTLIDSVKNAGKPREALEEAFTAERALRASKLEEVFTKGEGQGGYFQALSKLQGRLADTQTFESPNIDITQIDELFNLAQNAKHLDVYEKITTQNALNKLLQGQVPTRGELGLLEQVYGRELSQAVLSKRGILPKLGDAITEAFNVPRTMITSFDMSAPLRQGVLFVTKPRAFTAAGKEMFRQAFSPKNFDAWLDDLPNHPYRKEMKDGGLYIADPRNVSGGLAGKEEAFMSNIVQKIPFYGAVVRASERSFVAFLNKLRVDVFSDLVTQFSKDKKLTNRDYKSIASFVNHSTGRGSLGAFERSAQALNTVFFSPRLIASRFNMLNPVWYAQQTPQVRREAIKNAAKFVGLGSSILTMMNMHPDVTVELDPRSTDFGKIRVGNTRWDIWGGFQQWARVFAQIASGSKKTSSGEIVELDADQFPFTSRKDVIQRFIEGKFAPTPQLINEILQGQTFLGDDLELSEQVVENILPLYFQDVIEAVDEEGVEAIFTTGLPAFFGVGVSSYGGQSTPSTSGGANPFDF